MLYSSFGDIVRLFFEVVFVGHVLVFLNRAARDVWRAWQQGGLAAWDYVLNVWHVLEWTTLIITLVIITVRLRVLTRTSELLDTVEALAPSHYVNVQPLMEQLQQLQNLNAVLCLLLFVRVLHFISIVPQVPRRAAPHDSLRTSNRGFALSPSGALLHTPPARLR